MLTVAAPPAGLDPSTRVLATAFANDGATFATATSGAITLWRRSSWSRNDDELAVRVRDHAWPVLPGASPMPSRPPGTEITWRLAVADDDTLVVTGAGLYTLAILSSSGAPTVVQMRGPIGAVAFAADGALLVGEVEQRTGKTASFVTRFVPEEGPEGRRWQESNRRAVTELPLRALLPLPDGRCVLGFGGGVVSVLDAAAGDEQMRFPELSSAEHGAALRERGAASFALSRDGRFVAIQWQRCVEVWPLAGGEPTLVHLDDRAWSVALGHDGAHAVCGAPAAGTWRVADGVKLRALPVSHDLVATPDGRALFAGLHPSDARPTFIPTETP